MSLVAWAQEFSLAASSDLFTLFANPPISARPKLRWWWPNGLVDNNEITAEIDQMFQAGFGGAEIEDVHPSVHVPLDPVGHGWGTAPWTSAVQAASDHALTMGFQIDIALGPSYPASVPTLYPDDEGAEKELATGRVVVSGGLGYTGPVPPPYKAAGNGVYNQTLIALQAARMNTTSKVTAIPVVLDFPTLLDLTSSVSNGNISFAPPDNGTWLIIAYWYRGTGQTAEAGPFDAHDGSVIDHFSVAGIDSSIDYWNDNILNPDLKSLFNQIGGSMFEDSIELEYSTLWTPNLRTEFQNRMGYDLFSVLPAVAQENQKNAFSFSNSEITRGVINDYWDVLGQMYIDYHESTIKTWAHSLGMKFRAQVYGLPTDAMSAAAQTDIPEGETLQFKNLGDYRSLAGAANMAGLNLISNEACAFAAQAYTITWDLVLQTLNPVFTTGNNHQVLHGFSYLSAPTALWPGFAAFTPYNGNIGYAESWGPRIPLWNHAPDITGYIARMQFLLQRGTPQHDVAFFEQKGYIGAGYNSPWFADNGTSMGWSLNILGPAQLDSPLAKVKKNRLAPSGPNYKLLAFEGDAFTPARSPVMKQDSANKILNFAEAGLPMLLIGDWTNAYAFGYGQFNKSSQIGATMDKVLALPNVFTVPSRDNISMGVAQLATMGILPDVQYNFSQLINYHRVDGEFDHFLFVAASPATFAVSTKTKVYNVEADVLIPRRNKKQVPVLMNLWTGESTPLGEYTEVSAAQIRLHVSLKAYQSMIITMAPLSKKPTHAVSTSALSARRDALGLYIRANVTGNYSTTLSNGKTKKTTITGIPAMQELTSWRLSVQSWEPTSDLNSTATVYVYHNLTLNGLTPWSNITELQDVSGIGMYTTSFQLPSWPANTGAIMDIPNFVGSFRLTVNGVKMPPQDQLDTEFDVGPYLHAGLNTVGVEVATTLLNRLRVVEPSPYAVAARQNYGLVGPVMLKPYKEVQVAS